MSVGVERKMKWVRADKSQEAHKSDEARHLGKKRQLSDHPARPTLVNIGGVEVKWYGSDPKTECSYDHHYAEHGHRGEPLFIGVREGARIIVRYGIGVDSIDIPAATERGIFVANVPDYCLDEVSDHALALLTRLAARRHGTAAVLRALSRQERAPATIAAF